MLLAFKSTISSNPIANISTGILSYSTDTRAVKKILIRKKFILLIAENIFRFRTYMMIFVEHLVTNQKETHLCTQHFGSVSLH